MGRVISGESAAVAVVAAVMLSFVAALARVGAGLALAITGAAAVLAMLVYAAYRFVLLARSYSTLQENVRRLNRALKKQEE